MKLHTRISFLAFAFLLILPVEVPPPELDWFAKLAELLFLNLKLCSPALFLVPQRTALMSLNETFRDP